LASLADETIVYVDEAGMDSREDYSYGWNEKGKRFHALKSGRRQGRVNMIAALCLGQLMAPFTVVGACNRTVFEIWLETCLIPMLKPGQVVVMDNATFHKGGRTLATDSASRLSVTVHEQLIHRTSNLIERCWSWITSRIRSSTRLV
jgi:hypothetical protein